MIDTVEINRFETGQEFELSRICQRCIGEINSKDISKEQVKVLLEEFSPRGILNYANQFNLYVAITAQGRICGAGTLAGNQVKGVFVDVNLIGKGIGKQIMTFLENEAAKRGEKSIHLNSSIYAVEFYKKLGFKRIEISNSPVGQMIKMEKVIENI